MSRQHISHLLTYSRDLWLAKARAALNCPKVWASIRSHARTLTWTSSQRPQKKTSRQCAKWSTKWRKSTNITAVQIRVSIFSIWTLRCWSFWPSSDPDQKGPSAQHIPGMSGSSERVESSTGSLRALKLDSTPNPRTPVPKKPKCKKKKSTASIPTNEWSPAEDLELVHMVQTMKSPDWKRVAGHFVQRSPYACQKRYEKVDPLKLQ